jgi:hypothetical protein
MQIFFNLDDKLASLSRGRTTGVLFAALLEKINQIKEENLST